MSERSESSYEQGGSFVHLDCCTFLFNSTAVDCHRVCTLRYPRVPIAELIQLIGVNDNTRIGKVDTKIGRHLQWSN